MIRIYWLVALFTICFTGVGCGGADDDGAEINEMVCVPGSTQICDCVVDGEITNSTQFCTSDGSGFGMCDCGGTAESSADEQTESSGGGITESSTGGTTESSTGGTTESTDGDENIVDELAVCAGYIDCDFANGQVCDMGYCASPEDKFPESEPTQFFCGDTVSGQLASFLDLDTFFISPPVNTRVVVNMTMTDVLYKSDGTVDEGPLLSGYWRDSDGQSVGSGGLVEELNMTVGSKLNLMPGGGDAFFFLATDQQNSGNAYTLEVICLEYESIAEPTPLNCGSSIESFVLDKDSKEFFAIQNPNDNGRIAIQLSSVGKGEGLGIGDWSDAGYKHYIVSEVDGVILTTDTKLTSIQDEGDDTPPVNTVWDEAPFGEVLFSVSGGGSYSLEILCSAAPIMVEMELESPFSNVWKETRYVWDGVSFYGDPDSQSEQVVQSVSFSLYEDMSLQEEDDQCHYDVGYYELTVCGSDEVSEQYSSYSEGVTTGYSDKNNFGTVYISDCYDLPASAQDIGEVKFNDDGEVFESVENLSPTVFPPGSYPANTKLCSSGSSEASWTNEAGWGFSIKYTWDDYSVQQAICGLNGDGCPEGYPINECYTDALDIGGISWKESVCD